MKNTLNGSGCEWTRLAVVTVVLTLILGFLFSKSFQSNQVHFSNDGPLGVVNSLGPQLPDLFEGNWSDLHWIGANGGSAPVSITYLLLWILKPLGFAKFYPPLALLILGLCAWTFFRTIGLGQGLAIVGAIAAALNSNFLSNTAWGLGTRALTLGMAFLALAALSAKRVGHPWVNAALAGLCVGMGIIEGADNGAIFSLFVGAFVVAQSFTEEGPIRNKILGGARVVVVAVFAAVMAAQVLITLVGIASDSSGGPKAEEEAMPASFKWDFATQWSLPPAETLRVIIPGLYGYRMDTPEGGVYWGRVGEAPQAPQVAPRFSGAGEYAGIFVVLVALWAAAMSLSKSASVFSSKERKLIWFWAGAFVVSVLFSWGRHAPFYQLVYALPYFNSIRNPMKFMHPGHMAILVLFGYGLLGLSRRYLSSVAAKAGGQGRSWWAGAAAFEKRWTLASFALGAIGLLAFLVYAGSRASLARRLASVGLPEGVDPAAVAGFSVGEVGVFAVLLLISVGVLFLVMRGVFAGTRARWAVVLFALLVTVDLARASRPWILYWDYQQKYASNPVLDTLKAKPHEGRVVAPSFLSQAQGMQLSPLTRAFSSLYAIEWLQHHFQHYNIQSIDVAQDPRPPADKRVYMKTVASDTGRYWELTNTRWVIGLAGYLNALNSQFDKGRNRFRTAALFDITPKPGLASVTKLEDLTATLDTNGPLALFEYVGALPRAKLYSQWLVITNADETAKKLLDPAFDPAGTVVLAEGIPAPATGATNVALPDVDFISYSPKRIELKAGASVPTVLLLNDRYDPAWKISVDGQPSKLLRANVIMRGVQLPAGQHAVTFRFEPSTTGMKVTLAAVLLAGVLGVYLVVSKRRPAESDAEPAASAPPPGLAKSKS